MCCLVYKPKGASVPNVEIIKAVCKANPDGFGFATPKRHFRTLNRDIFIAELLRVPKNEPCIWHARWATHGSCRTSNCHPFRKKGIIFAHNGVLNIEPFKDKTDSETAFITRIYPAVDKFGLFSRETSSAVRDIIGGSRFAIMDRDGSVKLFGDFVKLGDGNFYSNLRFQHYLGRARAC